MRKLPLLLLALPIILMLGCVGLSPEESVNPVGTSHTVTATFGNGSGSPTVGLAVTFTITSGPNAGQTHNATTDANGQATFTYTSNGQMGKDTIKVCDNPGCTLVATAIKYWSIQTKMGSVDCDANVTVSDSIKIQQYLAGFVVTQTEPCPNIGDDIMIITN